MKSIRRGLFETNSSSVHSLSIVSKSDFEKWKKGELLFNWYEGNSEELGLRKPKEGELGWIVCKKCSNPILEIYNHDYGTKQIHSYGHHAMRYECPICRCEDYFEEAIGFELFGEVNESYGTSFPHHTTPSGDEVVAIDFYLGDN
jgi:beta-galactosidase GanA